MRNLLFTVIVLTSFTSCINTSNDGKTSVLGGMIKVDEKAQRVQIMGLIDVDGKEGKVDIAGPVKVDANSNYVNLGNGAVVVDNDRVNIKAQADVKTKASISIGSDK